MASRTGVRASAEGLEALLRRGVFPDVSHVPGLEKVFHWSRAEVVLEDIVPVDGFLYLDGRVSILFDAPIQVSRIVVGPEAALLRGSVAGLPLEDLVSGYQLVDPSLREPPWGLGSVSAVLSVLLTPALGEAVLAGRMVVSANPPGRERLVSELLGELVVLGRVARGQLGAVGRFEPLAVGYVSATGSPEAPLVAAWSASEREAIVVYDRYGEATVLPVTGRTWPLMRGLPGIASLLWRLKTRYPRVLRLLASRVVAIYAGLRSLASQMA